MSEITFVSGDYPVYRDRFEFALRSVVSRKGRRYSAAKRAGYDFNDVAGMLSSLDIMPVTPSGVVTGDSLGEEAVLAGVYFSKLNDRAFSEQELGVLRNYIAWLEMSQRERVLQVFLRKISSAKKVRVATVRAEGGYIMSFGSLSDGSSAVSKDVLSCLLGVEVRVENLSEVFYRRVLSDTELDSVVVSDKAGLLKIGVRHEKSLFDYLMKSGAAYGGGGYRLRHELDKRYGGYEKYLYACMSNDALRVGMDNAVSEFINGLNVECAQGEDKWRVVGIDRYNLYYTDDTPLSGFKLCIGDGLFYSGLVGEARDDYDAVQAGRRETHESIEVGEPEEAEGPEGLEETGELEELKESEGDEAQDPERGTGIANSTDELRNYVVDDIEETVASGTKGRPVGIYDDGTYPERTYSRYSRGDGHNRIVEYITPRRGVVLWPSSSYDEYGSKIKNSDKLDYTVMAEDAGLVVAGKGINRSGDRFSVGDTEARLGEYLNSNYVVVEGGAVTNSTLRKLLADHCKMFYFGNHTNNVYGFTGVEKGDYDKSLLLTALQGLSGMCSLSTVPSSDVVAGVLNTEAGIPQMVSLRLDGDYLPGDSYSEMERRRSWCCSLLSGGVFEKMLALPKDSLEWVVFDALLGYLNFGRFQLLRGDEDDGASDRASSEFVVPVDTSVDAFNKAVIHVYCILMGCQYSRICQE